MVRVLYLIENGSYRFDHRARPAVSTLRDAGCKVVVLCPPYKVKNLRETMDYTVELYRYKYPEFGKDFVGPLAEDAKLRTKLGKAGLKRVKDVLFWPHQAPNLSQIYQELFPGQIEWGTYSASA